jgi:hypothetical protein
MTIPIVGEQGAAAPLNGLSPRASNSDLGFELMKNRGRACSGSKQNAPRRCRIINPDEAAADAAI